MKPNPKLRKKSKKKASKSKGFDAIVDLRSKPEKRKPKKRKKEGNSKLEREVDMLFYDTKIHGLRKAMKKGATTDATAIEMTRAFLGSVLENVKLAEAAYRDKPHAHNSYALNGLMNQARELLADLRSLETADENRAAEVEKIVTIVMKRFTFQMAQQLAMVQAEAKFVPSKDRKRLTQAINEASNAIPRYTTEIGEQLMTELTK